jgi:hypothetical protein
MNFREILLQNLQICSYRIFRTVPSKTPFKNSMVQKFPSIQQTSQFEIPQIHSIETFLITSNSCKKIKSKFNS